ncbi:MAG: YsnF/AvaK domain-containing protein [Bryobacteraceae bacterium]
MPTSTQSTVVALFRNISDAQAAAGELKAQGFSDNDIYIGSESEGSPNTGSRTDTHHQEGGITGWFKRVFGQEEDETERPYYENAVRSGNVLLSVDTDDDNIDQAAEILNSHSPIDVHRQSSGASSANQTAGRASSTRGAQTGQSQSIPVVEEELRVGKRSVLRGGVRVYSRVVEQPVEETVNLREERVRVERQPVNREVNESDLRAGRDQVIEVQEYAEEPVVSKTARVVEEVRVNKEATERTEKVKDTVRRTEVNVENLDQSSGRTGSNDEIDADFRRHFTSAHGTSGVTYDDYAPAYRYGYQSASDPRFRGKSFDEVESDLESGYARQYPNSGWDRVKNSIRYGWDKVTGKASSAAGRK